MIFAISKLVFGLLAPSALVAGAAILVQRRIAKIDNSSLCSYIAIPTAIAALPIIYGVGMEAFIVLSGPSMHEADGFHARIIWGGPYRFYYWATHLGLLSSQLLWIRAIRTSPVAFTIIGLLMLLPARG